MPQPPPCTHSVLTSVRAPTEDVRRPVPRGALGECADPEEDRQTREQAGVIPFPSACCRVQCLQLYMYAVGQYLTQVLYPNDHFCILSFESHARLKVLNRIPKEVSYTYVFFCFLGFGLESLF